MGSSVRSLKIAVAPRAPRRVPGKARDRAVAELRRRKRNAARGASRRPDAGEIQTQDTHGAVRRALRRPAAGPTVRGGRRAHGFTLLEVMAAVAVLGILTTVLVRVASQGMAAEGDARRRLEASLLADQVLLELETAWKSGQPLEMGRVEDEREGFAVVVDVAPLDPATFGFGAALEPPPEEGRRGGGRREAETGAPSLFSAAGPNQPAILGFVTVVVSWMEGAHEQAVTRTSFALDRQAAAPLLEPLAPEGSGGLGGVPEGISLPQGAQPRGGLPRGGLPR